MRKKEKYKFKPVGVFVYCKYDKKKKKYFVEKVRRVGFK